MSLRCCFPVLVECGFPSTRGGWLLENTWKHMHFAILLSFLSFSLFSWHALKQIRVVFGFKLLQLPIKVVPWCRVSRGAVAEKTVSLVLKCNVTECRWSQVPTFLQARAVSLHTTANTHWLQVWKCYVKLLFRILTWAIHCGITGKKKTWRKNIKKHGIHKSIIWHQEGYGESGPSKDS